MDEVKLARFLYKIEEGYKDNPYHNRLHAADVVHSMHALLTLGTLPESLSHLLPPAQRPRNVTQLAAYLAAVRHATSPPLALPLHRRKRLPLALGVKSGPTGPAWS